MSKELTNILADATHFNWMIGWASGDGDFALVTTNKNRILCDKIEEYEEKYVLFMNNKKKLTLKKARWYIDKLIEYVDKNGKK